MQPAPKDRYFTAAEMLEDLASDAGTFETRAVTVGEAPPPASESPVLGRFGSRYSD